MHVTPFMATYCEPGACVPARNRPRWQTEHLRQFRPDGHTPQRVQSCACRGARVLVGLLSGVAPLAVQAQTRSTNDDQGVVEINDPTSPLRWFQLSDWYNASLHEESGSINDGVFRTVLPFTLAGDIYTVRFTQQYTISANNGKTGFQDPELILVRLISEPWGRWLVGLVVRPPTGAESQTSHAWSLGPALGLVTSSFECPSNSYTALRF